MRVFTNHDVANSICTHDEVGQPWEDRYSIDDHFKNQCTMDQVGSAKPIAPPAEPEEVFPPMTWAEAAEEAFRRLGPAKYFEWTEKNSNAFFDQASKMGMGQSAKSPSKALPDIEKIPDAELALMSSNDLKRIVLAAHGITKQSQLSDDL